MGEERNSEAVVYFDANMPKPDRCSKQCLDNDLIFCCHRLSFNAEVVSLGNSIVGLDDFMVVDRCFEKIEKSEWPSSKVPRFFIVTKDANFIADVIKAYSSYIRAAAPIRRISFKDNLIYSGKFFLSVVYIKQKKYGSNRIDNLRSAFQKLNQLWMSR